MALQAVGTVTRRCNSCGLVGPHIKYQEEGGGSAPVYACQECGVLAHRAAPRRLAVVSTSRAGLLAGLANIKELLACE